MKFNTKCYPALHEIQYKMLPCSTCIPKCRPILWNTQNVSLSLSTYDFDRSTMYVLEVWPDLHRSWKVHFMSLRLRCLNHSASGTSAWFRTWDTDWHVNLIYNIRQSTKCLSQTFVSLLYAVQICFGIKHVFCIHIKYYEWGVILLKQHRK